MKLAGWWFTMIIFMSLSYGTDETRYRSSQDYISTHLVPSFNIENAKSLPHYQGEHVPEAAMVNQPAAVTNNGGQQITHGELGKFLRMTEAERPLFKDFAKEGFFKESDTIIQDPLKILKAQKTTVAAVNTAPTTHHCIEGGEPERLVCRKRRLITVREPKPAKFEIVVRFYNHGQGNNLGIDIFTGRQLDGVHSYNGGGHSTGRTLHVPLPQELHNRIIGNPRLISGPNITSFDGRHLWRNGSWCNPNEGQFSRIEVIYKPLLREADITETIEDGCELLEKRAEESHCVYAEKTIIAGAGPRTFGELKITRDWWEIEYSYDCNSLLNEGCAALRARGCQQVGSSCHKMQNGRCTEYLQKFMCLAGSKGESTIHLGGEVPYCLDGNCDKHAWAANKDMAEALSYLMALREAQHDMDGQAQIVFRGGSKACSKDCLSFRDCCGQGKGWGTSLGYGCSEEEKALALSREQGKCKIIGTYCSQKEKLTGICLTKKTSYCCFNSKLARLIHEQGRAQLGIGWGDAEHPSCRALSVEELSRIDFSRLDLSELFADIYARVKVPDMNKFSCEVKQSIGNTLPQIPDPLKKNINLPQNKPDAKHNQGSAREF